MYYDVSLGLYIGGEWRTGHARASEPVINPADGTPLADLPHASAQDLDDALDAADRGFKEWSVAAPAARAAIMNKAAALLQERAARIATIVTLEQGKPTAEAAGEIGYAVSLLQFHAGETLRIYGRVLQREIGSRSLVLHQPVGPVAAFCAWNFPILNVMRKAAPALAAGCSVILKASEETPASAIEVVRCFQDAGLPGNVLQAVFGVPDEVSRHVLASPVTRKLSFTGSVAVGKHLMRLAADTMMRTTLELGGHAPVLVFDDCDVDKAVELLVAHKFRNAGQVCIAPTRFYVQDAVYDRFVDLFAGRTEQLTLGAGINADTQVGPMANDRRPAAIEALVADARQVGARVLTGGERVDGNGYFFRPTVLADVPVTARAMNEEPFGPVALFSRFETLEEGIALANRLPYGLAAYCFTENGRRQNILGDRIEAGMVGINSIRLSAPDSPFGGVKDSGHGSEDGPEGVLSHMITKSVHIA